MKHSNRPFSPKHFGFLLFTILALGSFASAEWKEKVLYSFQGGSSDGATPAGGVVFDQQGNLYGATSGGGSGSCTGWFPCGTVFELSPPAQKGGAWTETVLYNFQGSQYGDGASPGGLVIDQAGNLYGSTGYGGTGDCVLLGSKEGCGTVYELSPPQTKGGAWTETVLYSLQGGNDGYVPDGDLVFDKAGNLYGATIFGGGKGTTCNALYQYCGTVFELRPPKQKGGKWTEKVLHSFAGGTDGATPNGGLTLDSKGAIYGTTSTGGNQGCKTNYSVGCGTVFELKPPKTKTGRWQETELHRFADGKDGAGPNGGLIFGTKGSLYGSGGGGARLDGLAFHLARTAAGRWAEEVVYAFTGGSDGFGPGPLVVDSGGSLYGTAFGGTYFRGTVFKLKPARGHSGWAFSLIYTFTGAPDGAYPTAAITFGGTGTLYSTTQGGGTGQLCQGGCGTVFEVSP
jgi:hypothetical protein